jgi:hypothetical protein
MCETAATSHCLHSCLSALHLESGFSARVGYTLSPQPWASSSYTTAWHLYTLKPAATGWHKHPAHLSQATDTPHTSHMHAQPPAKTQNRT